ncbi:MAG: ABC transporter permease subunit [Oscillospiraceae bacterium]|nr:ABC transporter permease subunit [Oscillospiraceae bacterium]
MKRKYGSRRQSGGSFLFLLPSLLGIGCFYLLPFLLIVGWSFLEDPFKKTFVGFQNYASLLCSAAFRLALKNTLLFLGGAVLSAVALSLALALLLRALVPHSRLLRAVLVFPLTVPVVTVVLLTTLLLDWHGVLNGLLGLLKLPPADWLDGVLARRSMLLLYLWKHCGLYALLFLAALETVPKEEREAAALDGAGTVRTFLSVELPHLLPAFLFVALVSLFFGFRFFREISLLEGRYPTASLYMLQHFMRNVFALLDYQKICAAAVLLFLMAALALGLPAALLRRRGGAEFLSLSDGPGFGPRRKRPAAAAALILLLLLPGLLPTLVTLVHSLAGEAELAGRYARVLKQLGAQEGPVRLLLFPEEPSLRAYLELWKGRTLLRAFGRSLLYTLPALAVQLPVAVCAAWGFSRLRGRLRDGLLLTYLVLLLLPWEVTLVPNFLVARFLGFLETPWAVWLPSVFSPLPVYLLTKELERLPAGLREAAALDGAGELRTLTRVLLPNLRSALGAVLLLDFIDLWNAVELPRTLLRRAEKLPLSVTLGELRPDDPLGPVFAASFLYMLPPLLLFLLLFGLRRK